MRGLITFHYLCLIICDILSAFSLQMALTL